MTPLTEDQIRNWRHVLFVTLGPYAYLMTDEEVQAYYEKMQERLSKYAADHKVEG